MSNDTHLPRLVIIGRPNVGKSTLFNRLLGRRRALVHDVPGVTRDRLEEEARWIIRGKGFPILMVDTGGLGGEKFHDEIGRQVDIALTRADVVVMVFDGQVGLTPADEQVIQQLKQSGLPKHVPVIGAVNKVDDDKHETMLNEFYASGLDPLITVSAEHNRGIDDLEEMIFDLLPDNKKTLSEGEETRQEGPPKIAIIGRPNVGKSTLVNALSRQERMITSPMAGTTVDAVDTEVTLNGKPFILVDTAGIRRKSKTEQGVEVLSVVQARKALERCDVAVLLLDGETGTTDQDEKIGSLIEEVGCGVILALNKWDTQKNKKDFKREDAAEIIRKKFAYLRYAPLMFVSAKEKKGFEGLGDLVEEILRQRQVKIATHAFTEWVRARSEIHNPGNAKFYMCHQSGRHPPTFVCHVSDPKKIHFSLKRNLLNGIREEWGYMGNPIRLLFVKGKNNQR